MTFRNDLGIVALYVLLVNILYPELVNKKNALDRFLTSNSISVSRFDFVLLFKEKNATNYMSIKRL